MQKIIRYKYVKKRKLPKIPFNAFILFIFLLLTVRISYLYFNNPKEYKLPFINPLSSIQHIIEKTGTFINSTQNSKSLEQIIGQVLKDKIDNYGIVIENLRTGERYFLNENKIFETASLYKLWVMAAIYQEIENGDLNKTTILNSKISSLNNQSSISSDSAVLAATVISTPLKYSLEKMITISDNNSAMLLTEKVGLKNITKFLQKYNLNESKVGTAYANPMTSAKDIASYFRQIYEGKFANKQNSAEMINLLLNQKVNRKLPKKLPANVEIAHKTGELEKLSHDGGIVYTDKGNYIIVVLSKTNNTEVADENIADISMGVYNYFSN